MRSQLGGLSFGAVLVAIGIGTAFADRGPVAAPQPQQDVVRATTLLPDGGAPVWYVNKAGNDANDCMSTARACLTPQGAINKVPKMLRHQATVSIDAGTYPGFIVSGFSADNGFQQTTGGLLIDGALDLAKPLTGTASGSATSGTAGSGSTFGTLVDNLQTWTTNDLAGSFISTTNPTNTMLVIGSNTATTLTVVGAWSAPTGPVTTYTIQDPSVIINTNTTFPASPTSPSNSTLRAVEIQGNSLWYKSQAMVLRNMRVAAPASGNVGVDDNSSILFTAVQVRPTSLIGAQGFNIGTQNTATRGRVMISGSDISSVATSSTPIGIFVGSGSLSLTTSIVRSANNLGTAVSFGSTFGSLPFAFAMQTMELRGFTNGLFFDTGVSQGGVLSNIRITCGGSSGIGVHVGNETTNIVGFASVLSPILQWNIATCGTALQVIGPAVADVTSMSGSVGTTGFDVRLGGVVTYAKAGMTLTAGTNEVNIENGEVVGTFATGTAGQCRVSSTSGNYSRVCAR